MNEKIMKKFYYLLIIVLTVLVAVPTVAQSEKQLKKEIKEKALKDARKEAKRLKKEGFSVAPGQLPLDKQIENTWMKRYEVTDEGNPKYFVADARATGESHSAAKMRAFEIAKINIAEQIGPKVAGLVSTNLANSQLNAEEAASITKTVGSFKSKVQADIGNMLTLFEASKNIGKNTEVFITLAYGYDAAMKLAKEKLRKQMEEAANVNAKQLDDILDF